jgi:hypothetical protein
MKCGKSWEQHIIINREGKKEINGPIHDGKKFSS